MNTSQGRGPSALRCHLGPKIANSVLQNWEKRSNVLGLLEVASDALLLRPRARPLREILCHLARAVHTYRMRCLSSLCVRVVEVIALVYDDRTLAKLEKGTGTHGCYYNHMQRTN